MLLFELGVIFEAYSTDSAKRSIEEMIDIRPPYATKKSEAGEVKVQPSELEVGDLIVIKPYELCPVAHHIIRGRCDCTHIDKYSGAINNTSLFQLSRHTSFPFYNYM